MKMTEKLQYKIKLDTTNRHEQTISLYEGDKLIEEVKGMLDLVVVIKNLLEKHNLDILDISEFSANPGPGSFTGIRKGITVANILNWAQKDSINKKEVQPHYGSEPTIHTK